MILISLGSVFTIAAVSFTIGTMLGAATVLIYEIPEVKVVE